MLKLRSDRSLISQFNGHIQKQRSHRVLHIVFYQVKLNMRSKRSVIFSVFYKSSYSSAENVV